MKRLFPFPIPGGRANVRTLLLSSALLCLFTAASTLRADPIVNGSFTQGNVGFATDYTYTSTNLYPEGDYATVSNPNSLHNLFISSGDHTTGDGLALVVNGAVTPNETVWAETVQLAANTGYVFSVWAENVNPDSTAQLALSLNGSQLGDVFSATGLGNWQLTQRTFNTTTAGAYTFRIVDQNTDASGNDFALDDISVAATPEPSSLAMLGTGVLSMAGMVRRRLVG